MSLDITLLAHRPMPVFEVNITHNLASMADAAGVYACMWRPAQAGVRTAADLIVPLEKALVKMTSDPQRFKALNPKNGWGDFGLLQKVITELLAACRANPDALVRACV